MSELKTERVYTRLSERERNIAQRMTEREGLSMSGFLRSLLIAEIKREQIRKNKILKQAAAKKVIKKRGMNKFIKK